MKTDQNISSFDDLINGEYGKAGSKPRNVYEENAHRFIINEMLKQGRKEAKITQQQLAEKTG